MKRYERIEAHLGGNLLAVFEGTKNAKKEGKIEESAKEKLYGFEMSWNFGLVRSQKKDPFGNYLIALLKDRWRTDSKYVTSGEYIES
ncbi:hypothetical protein QR98_0048100 [Sarcoptes scabiei]|uniref:Uncharacterized protein n=1 Tax=Sarcoptes scabiei TaxID=52283 RepID=A0A132A5U0_SARSC|nr:hypothetical protein QR98_0048100 [Sarcoptes scabiei]